MEAPAAFLGILSETSTLSIYEMDDFLAEGSRAANLLTALPDYAHPHDSPY